MWAAVHPAAAPAPWRQFRFSPCGTTSPYTPPPPPPEPRPPCLLRYCSKDDLDAALGAAVSSKDAAAAAETRAKAERAAGEAREAEAEVRVRMSNGRGMQCVQGCFCVCVCVCGGGVCWGEGMLLPLMLCAAASCSL
jgi:hypothetical protein